MQALLEAEDSSQRKEVVEPNIDENTSEKAAGDPAVHENSVVSGPVLTERGPHYPIALQNLPFACEGEVTIASKAPVFSPPPARLDNGVIECLKALLPGGLYQHQTVAIDASLDGHDVCVATPTASGKSLVFQALAAHHAKQREGSLTIAIYPVRALVQDQHEKWRKFLDPLGLNVGRIDGTIHIDLRENILRESDVVVMTPDVVHAWLLARIATTRQELERLSLVVLDEAHTYTGYFGTNMAYLTRRLAVAAGDFQLVASTATIGEPESFMQELTGRSVVCIGDQQNGAGEPTRTIKVVRANGRAAFDALVALLRRIIQQHPGKFLAFADSRKMVEQLAAVVSRPEDGQPGIRDVGAPVERKLMPYRAGYAAADRTAIQNELNNGTLKGVITTSALELGVDIGEVDLVVLLNTPPSIQSFRQRLGRAGRRGQNAECILVDTKGVIPEGSKGLEAYLRKVPERNYLYLENRYIQYINALCAARESAEGIGVLNKWATVRPPAEFLQMLENEINAPAQPEKSGQRKASKNRRGSTVANDQRKDLMRVSLEPSQKSNPLLSDRFSVAEHPDNDTRDLGHLGVDQVRREVKARYRRIRVAIRSGLMRESQIEAEGEVAQ